MNEFCPNITPIGIITNVWSSCPWKDVETGITGVEIEDALDSSYRARSGTKFIAPIMYDYKSLSQPILDYRNYNLVAALVTSQFGAKWTHLWELYSLEYSPLNSYNMTESYERDETRELDDSSTRTPNLTEHNSGTDNLATTDDVSNQLKYGHKIEDDGSDKTTTEYGKIVVDSGLPTDERVSQVKGFNSSDWADTAKESNTHHTDNRQESDGSDSTELEYGKSETHSGIDETIVDGEGTRNRTLNLTNTKTGTETTIGAEDETNHEEFSSTKQGTMYRAPAELMSLDRDFWLTEYFSIVFADIDSLLTLAIFSERDPITKVY